MKMAGALGFVVCGAAFFLFLAYSLHRGVLIHADVELPIFGGPPWPKYCTYLQLSGVRRISASFGQAAGTTYCPFLGA